VGVRDSIAKFLLGSEFVAKAKASTGSSGMVQPSQPLPPAWAATTFAPGWPITPAVHPYEDELPREIDYPMAVNVTLVPRTAYGLMPFSALASVYETVAEVNMCVFTLIREMGNFEPKLVDEDGNPADDHSYVWLTESPDRVTPWAVWLTRFLQSVLVFDAGAFYIERDGEELKGLHFLDGSTILLFVDEHGRTPEPPAPAYGQVIKGMPFSWWTREAVWYKPRFRRYDAPYGRTPIEQAWPWILTIANITGFELAHYREGNLPEGVVEAPEGASLEQIAYYEEQFNARMSSGAAERMRVRFLPPGFSNMRVLKKADFPEALYKQALQNVALAFGLPQTEFGNVPGQGLGGRGFMDVMDKTFYRMALGPLKSYVCSAFNDVLTQFGVEDVKFDLQLPQETLDPKEAQNAVIAEFNAGLVKLNEARSTLGYDPVDGGDVLLTVQGGQVINISQALTQPAPQPTETPPAPPATGESGTGSSPPFQSPTPVTKVLGVDLEDDLYYGSPVEQAVPVPLLGHHRNDVEIVTIKPVGLPERPALWKPLDGEHPGLIRRIGGWQGCREEAAYLIDRMLGLYLVPVAYLSDLDGERGAVLYYVPGNDPAKPVAEYQERWLEKAALLDTVLCNLDRHSGNWLTHPDDPGRPVLIDNGLTFPATEHAPSSPFVIAWGERPFSMSLLVKLEGLTQDRRWQRVKELVGEQAAALTEKRINGLLSTLDGMGKAEEIAKGGPGSGNFGHAGRPGQVGGSAPGGGAAADDKPGSLRGQSEKVRSYTERVQSKSAASVEAIADRLAKEAGVSREELDRLAKQVPDTGVQITVQTRSKYLADNLENGLPSYWHLENKPGYGRWKGYADDRQAAEERMGLSGMNPVYGYATLAGSGSEGAGAVFGDVAISFPIESVSGHVSFTAGDSFEAWHEPVSEEDVSTVLRYERAAVLAKYGQASGMARDLARNATLDRYVEAQLVTNDGGRFPIPRDANVHFYQKPPAAILRATSEAGFHWSYTKDAKVVGQELVVTRMTDKGEVVERKPWNG